MYVYIYIYPVAILAQEPATMASQGARFNPFFWTQGSVVPWRHGVQGQHPPTGVGSASAPSTGPRKFLDL